MSYSTNQLEQIFSEKPFLTAKYKANGNYSYVEACEQIKQVYENELHYVLIGENTTYYGKNGPILISNMDLY